MKYFPLNGFRIVTVVATTLFAASGLRAGEAIQFSNARSRPDPNQKQNLPGESSRSGLNFGSRGPLEGLSTTRFQSGRLDPRAERQARNAEDERKNWMVLDPGQLDAEDEDNTVFGLNNYDSDRANGKRNYFFASPEDKGDRPGFTRPPSGSSRVPGKSRNSSEAISKETTRDSNQNEKDTKGSQSVDKDGRPVGDHVSKDLDMKDLLAPGKANSLAPSEDKTTKLWREILGTGASGEARDEISSRRDNGSAPDGFRPSTSLSIRAQESGPAFGFRNDFGARPGAASSPGLSGSASTGFTPPAGPMAPRTPDPNLGRPSTPLTAGRAPSPNDASSTRQNGFGSGPAGSSFGQQSPPRRPTSSGFDIPARPGYGGR